MAREILTVEPSHLSMSVSEVRLRLAAARKIFPLGQIAELMHMPPRDLRSFINNLPQRKDAPIGPYRLKKLAKICLEIETGILEWNHKPKRYSRVWRNDEPKRSAAPIHRIQFNAGMPALLQGPAPKAESMPSFKSLFAPKTRTLPFLLKSVK